MIPKSIIKEVIEKKTCSNIFEISCDICPAQFCKFPAGCYTSVSSYPFLLRVSILNIFKKIYTIETIKDLLGDD